MIKSINDLEYSIFGSYSVYKKDLEESEKLGIATGGEDMPELETEKKTEKRI